MTEPTSQDPSRPDARKENAITVWLDALAQGVCPPHTFLRAMHEQFPGDSDGNWEVLALLDQYYRLGKLNADIFHTVKAGIEDSALGAAPAAPPTGATEAVAPPRPAAGARRARGPVRTAPVELPDLSGVFDSEVDDPDPPMTAAPPRPPPARDLDPIPTLHQAPLEDTHKHMRLVGVGDVLRGRYRIRRMLGEGGMGSVFEATDGYRLDVAGEGQRIAIKVLHPDIQRREELLNELQGEFQLLQSLSHPNIVRVHEIDRDGEIAFFTMELLIGTQLSRVLVERDGVPLPIRYSFALIRDLGAAMAYAHLHGVVHGDINPQNVFVTNDGELRVLDFGAGSRRTPVATPGYASCQVLEGQLPERRDDVFAFACLAYVLLTGRHPFAMQSSLQARLQRIRPAKPAALTGRQWRVLRQGLRWDREQRPGDLGGWLGQLKLKGAAPRIPSLPALLSAAPQRRSIALRAAAVIFIVLLAGVGYWASSDQDKLSAWYAQGRTQALALWTKLSTAVAQETSRLTAGRPPEPSLPAGTTATSSPEAATPAPVDEGRPQEPVGPPPAAVSHAPPVGAAAPLTASTPASTSAPRIPLGQPAALRPAPVQPTPAEPVAAARGAMPSAAGPGAAPAAVHGEPRPANPAYTKVEMATDTVDVPPDATVAQVVIRRRGSTRGDAAFMLWTESGTAKPGQDFTASTPHQEIIHEGSGAVTVSVPVSNAPRTKPASFYVVIDQADDGPGIVNRRLTMVTLQPTE